VLFFLANWGKISPSSAEGQAPQQEFLTPIRQTLLLHEGRMHPVTEEFSPDFYYLVQFSASFLWNYHH
jgi:hypothetical protein